MATPFGQEGSAAARALGTAFGQTYKSTKLPKSKSVRPKNVNKNIKVSQSEIDSIKKLGMKKALQIAAMNKGSVQQGAVASFAEGVRRLYGETRYQNAIYTPKASPGPVASNFSYSGPNNRTKSNFTYSAPSASKPSKATVKSKTNTAINAWNPNRDSVAAKVIRKIGSSAKKAYLGK